MTNPTTAYQELTTRHNTMSYDAPDGRVTCRKTQGQYIVVLERYSPSNVTRMVFKTQRGALTAFDEARSII